MKIGHLQFVLLIALVASTQAQSLLRNHTFQVPEYIDRKDGKRFVVRQIHGSEHPNNSLNRLSMISEHQIKYPSPESGCGPVAMLNILMWYEKYGLIKPLFRESDPERKKLKFFNEIDRRLIHLSGVDRELTGGTSTNDIMIVMDEIVLQQSGGKLRLHADYHAAPLQLKDLLDTMPNFRAGYIVGRPIDSKSGQLLGSHGMSIIRVDRAGYLTLANWGNKYTGLLMMRDGKQIFVPQDSEHLEIQIDGFYRFIPFKPTTR